ncbi:hypothetical protein [Amycolatopsis minnesotensis]|uniref:Uncharacterized protein n=1 Tax=Amycolatopsis minnesotensis TaxID=337894 RepID=A0ABN2SC41_9PSEU
MFHPHGDHNRSRRFAVSSFITALPRPGETSRPASAWHDLARALPWLFVVFFGALQHWTAAEVTGLIAMLTSAVAKPVPPRPAAAG